MSQGLRKQLLYPGDPGPYLRIMKVHMHPK